jgi:hypothetical protein
MRLRYCPLLVVALCAACGHGSSAPNSTPLTQKRPTIPAARVHDGSYSGHKATTYDAGYAACSAWISAIVKQGASPSPGKLDPATAHLLQAEQSLFATSAASIQIWQHGCDSALRATGHGADIATIDRQTITTSP